MTPTDFIPNPATPSRGEPLTSHLRMGLENPVGWSRLELHCVVQARCLADDNAGNNSAARIPMMAMTTSNSMSVKAPRGFIPDKTPPFEIRFKLLLSISKCPPDGKTGHLFFNPSLSPPPASRWVRGSAPVRGRVDRERLASNHQGWVLSNLIVSILGQYRNDW